MARKILIEPDLLKRAVEVSGERTEEAAVTTALQKCIARWQQKALLDLMGHLEWDDHFDYKAEHSRG